MQFSFEAFLFCLNSKEYLCSIRIYIYNPINFLVIIKTRAPSNSFSSIIKLVFLACFFFTLEYSTGETLRKLYSISTKYKIFQTLKFVKHKFQRSFEKNKTSHNSISYITYLSLIRIWLRFHNSISFNFKINNLLKLLIS